MADMMPWTGSRKGGRIKEFNEEELSRKAASASDFRVVKAEKMRKADEVER